MEGGDQLPLSDILLPAQPEIAASWQAFHSETPRGPLRTPHPALVTFTLAAGPSQPCTLKDVRLLVHSRIAFQTIQVFTLFSKIDIHFLRVTDF